MDSISSIAETLVSSEILLQKLWWFADLTQMTPDRKRSLRLRLNTGDFTHRDCFSEIIQGWVSLKGREATIGALVTILREMECIDVAQQLEQRFACYDDISVTNVIAVNSITNDIWRNEPIGMGFTNCEKPYNFFAGRETELQDLRNAVQTPETCNLVLITGLAGIGKTEIARKFCEVYKQEHKMSNCLWILAEDEGILKSQLENVANTLNLPLQSNCTKSFQSIVEKLQGQLILIVFDNVDLRNREVENILKEYFRKDGIVFIVTSRDKTMLEEYSPISIDLEVLPLQAAMECVAGPLKLDLKSRAVRSEISLLCEEIQCYSLALRQAIAYIQRQRKVGKVGKTFSVSHYIAKLKSAERIKLLGMEKFDHKYKSSTLKTMCVTLDHISTLENGEEAITLLRLISYIPPEKIKLVDLEKFVSYYLKQQGKALPASEENGLDVSIEILKSYCLVQSENEVLNVHRMVQEVTRYYYKDWILRDAEIFYKPNFLLKEDEGYYQYNHMLKIQLKSIPYGDWRGQIFCIILDECESEGFPAFLRKNWRSFISANLDLLNSELVDWTWKFINIVRNIFGSLCHPGIFETVSKLLQYSSHSEFQEQPTHSEWENILETLWHDCFPSEGSMEFGISENHELYVPFHEWEDNADELGRFFAESANHFVMNGECQKCLEWVPRWRLVRNTFFTKSWLTCDSTPFPTYFSVLFKEGSESEATKLYNEECVLWKPEDCWDFVASVLMKVEYMDEEDGFSKFCGVHLKEQVLQGLSHLSSNIRSRDYVDYDEKVPKSFQEIFIFQSDELSSCFKGDEEFCKAVWELILLLGSYPEAEINRIFDPVCESLTIVDSLYEIVAECNESELE